MHAWTLRQSTLLGCNIRNFTIERTENRLRNMPCPLCFLCCLSSSVVKNVRIST